MFSLHSGASVLAVLSVLWVSAPSSPQGALLTQLTHLDGTITPNIFQGLYLIFCHQDVLPELSLIQVFNPRAETILAWFRCPALGPTPLHKESGQDR